VRIEKRSKRLRLIGLQNHPTPTLPIKGREPENLLVLSRYCVNASNSAENNKYSTDQPFWIDVS
jgi:hypothetical protein